MILNENADADEVSQQLQARKYVMGRQLADGSWVVYKCRGRMRPTTQKRHRRIREAYKKIVGTMPAMHIYAHLAEEFDLSEERIRKILARKKSPPNTDWSK